MSSGEELYNKKGRAVCYKARDGFFSCCLEQGVDWEPGMPIPSKCKEKRKSFEDNCLSSWVTYFDSQQEATVRKAKTMSILISENYNTSAGGLAGKKLN
uniref:Cytochrome c oxidase assembly factor 6 homolog n=1 Tax=Polytomella parva TaxID=51329 RepID=A0A7S0Y8L8_9CHLO